MKKERRELSLVKYLKFDMKKFLKAEIEWQEIKESRKLGVGKPESEEDEKREKYHEIYEDAIKLLTEVEKDILCTIFTPEKMAYKKLCKKHVISESLLYEKRNRIEKEISQYLENTWGMQTLAEFYTVDINSFFKDSQKWRAKIREFEDEKASMYSLRAISSDGTGASGSVNSDSVGSIVVSIEKYEKKIERERMYLKILDELLGLLETPLESEIIHVTFFDKSRRLTMGAKVDRVCAKYGYCRGMFYEKKRIILENMKKYIMENYIQL